MKLTSDCECLICCAFGQQVVFMHWLFSCTFFLDDVLTRGDSFARLGTSSVFLETQEVTVCCFINGGSYTQSHAIPYSSEEENLQLTHAQ